MNGKNAVGILIAGLIGLSLSPHARADKAGLAMAGAIGPMTGEEIYDHICAGCHMAGGAGAVGAGHYPKLAANQKFVSWEFVALVVLNGRKGMPPFGRPKVPTAHNLASQLTDAQVAEVVNYVRGHFDNRYKPTVTEKQVQALPHPEVIPYPF